jgi:hypothetical protein
MTVSKLTKQSEEAIGDALTEVSDMVTGGATPNEAIVKVATARSIPAGHVRIMARAYNNGRSVGHVKGHTALLDKAASFPLADAQAILEQMYPDHVKTAAAELESRPSADYSMSPQYWLARRQEAVTFEKVASNLPEPKEEPKPDGSATERDGVKMWATQQKIARTLDELQHDRVRAGYKVASAIDELTEYFRHANSLPLPGVRENVKLMYGDRGDRLMAKFAAVGPPKRYSVPHVVYWDEAPYSLVKIALDAIQDFADADAALTDGVKTAETQKQETLRPFVPARTQRVLTGSVWDSPSGSENGTGRGRRDRRLCQGHRRAAGAEE